MNINKLETIKEKIRNFETTTKLLVWINENNQNVIKKIKLKGDLKKTAICSLDKLISSLKNKEKKSVPELNLENELEKHYHLPSSDVLEFTKIKENLFMCDSWAENLREIDSLENTKIRAFVIEFEYLIEGIIKKIYLFIKFEKAQILKKKNFCVYREGSYQEIQDDYFIFPEVGDALYLGEDDRILVFVDKKFEQVFKFSEIHKTYANSFLDAFNSESISNLLCIKDKIMSNKTYCKELYKVSKLEKYKEIDIEKLSLINNELNYNLTIKNTIWHIKETDDIKVILNVLNRKIGKDVLIAEDEYYYMNAKENIIV